MNNRLAYLNWIVAGIFGVSLIGCNEKKIIPIESKISVQLKRHDVVYRITKKMRDSLQQENRLMDGMGILTEKQRFIYERNIDYSLLLLDVESKALNGD